MCNNHCLYILNVLFMMTPCLSDVYLHYIVYVCAIRMTTHTVHKVPLLETNPTEVGQNYAESCKEVTRLSCSEVGRF